MAQLHAQCFTGPECWGADAFGAARVASGAVFASLDGGFVLGRVVLDEAELLTLAVPMGMRRKGLGRALLGQFAAQAARMGAVRAFLEVSARNQAARGLYLADGWAEQGRRRAYYHDGSDAVVMTRDLAG